MPARSRTTVALHEDWVQIGLETSGLRRKPERGRTECAREPQNAATRGYLRGPGGDGYAENGITDPLPTSMVRRGWTVRVRKRALQKAPQAGACLGRCGFK